MSKFKNITPALSRNSPTAAFVALDIGKNLHTLAAYAGPQLQPICDPQPVPAHQAGLSTLTDLLERLLADRRFDQVVFGHEPTGVYHLAWAHAIFDRFAAALRPDARPRLRYLWLNPYQTKLERLRLLGRNRKTDPLDTLAIARGLASGLGTPASPPSPAQLAAQLWAERYRRLAHLQRRFALHLSTTFDRLWPGAHVKLARFQAAHPDAPTPTPLVTSKPFERLLIQALIQHAPDPYSLLPLSPDQLLAWLRRHLRRAGPATAQRLYDLLHRAVLPPPDIAALLAQHLQADFRAWLDLRRQLDALNDQAADLVKDSPAAVLTSIPGLSPSLALRYFAHIGQPERFAHAGQIWALAGFDPLPSDSGDAKHSGAISRKGDPALRETLFLIGLHTARACPPIAAAKQRALERKLSRVGAVIHAAHKANRLCWALLRSQQAYNPGRHA